MRAMSSWPFPVSPAKRKSPCRSSLSLNWPTVLPAPIQQISKRKTAAVYSELLMAIPIHPVTVPIAFRVGQIDGENQARGVRLPLADLLIGGTALELGYGVATANLRHFQKIPGLRVVPL